MIMDFISVFYKVRENFSTYSLGSILNEDLEFIKINV